MPRWEGARSPGCEQGLWGPGATWIPLKDDAGPANRPPVRAERRWLTPSFTRRPGHGAAGLVSEVGLQVIPLYPPQAPFAVRPAVPGSSAEVQLPPPPALSPLLRRHSSCRISP